MYGGKKLSDNLLPMLALARVTPSSASPSWINCAKLERLVVVVFGVNSTTVTGSAITLKQATDTSGTSSKALAFATAQVNNDLAGNGQAAWTKTAVSNNSYTLDNTDSKKNGLMIDVDLRSLDVANSFTCLQVGVGNATAQTVEAWYIAIPTYGGNAQDMPVVTS